MLFLYIRIYCQYSSTQLRLPAESVLVWTKSRFRCIYTSMDIVLPVYTYCSYLIYIYVSDIHILIVTICYSTLLAFWECDRVDEVAFLMYIYVYRCCLCVFMNIGPGVSEIWIYVYCPYSSTQLCLPPGSVLVWTKSGARYVYIRLLMS